MNNDRKLQRFPMPFVAVAAAAALAACGGGGADGVPDSTAGAPQALLSAGPADDEGGPSMAVLSAGSSADATSGGYYVDSRNGSDSNDGSASRPWRTLSRLAGVKASASAPINLRCDGVWRETLDLGPAQLAPGAVIQAWGTCSNSTAVVSGADDVSGGWSRSGAVWSRNIGAGRGVTQLFVNGKAHRVARWPNAAGSDLSYAITDANSSPVNTSMLLKKADVDALAGRDLKGAKVHLRTGGASTQILGVSSLDGASRRLTFHGKASRNLAGGHGYVLIGLRWMVDAPGEFAYDDASGMLYVVPLDSSAQSDLNAARVEASVRDNAIRINNVSGVTLRGVAGVKARADGIRVYDAPKAVLQSVTAIDNGRAGAAVISSTPSAGSIDGQVLDGVFVRNSLYGVDAAGTTRAVLRRNVVKDTGMGMFLGQPMAGLWGGPGNVIENNVVQRSALTGLRFSGASGSKVRGNVVVDACLRFSDCGVIYTWNGPKRSDWKSGQSSLVQGNVVGRAPAYLAGAGPDAPWFNVGIYYDAYSAGSTTDGNWAFEVAIGIKLHNSSNITVSSNRVAGATAAALWANMDDPSTDYMTGNVFENNQLAPASVASGSYPQVPGAEPAHAVWFWHRLAGSASIATGGNVFRGNDIMQLNDPAIPVAWFHGADGDWYALASRWDQVAPNDDPVKSPAQFALYRPVLGGELVSNGRFDGGLGGWDAWFAGGGSLAASAVAGCSGTCARFAATSVHDTLISPSFQVAGGAMYQVDFGASFVTPGSANPPGLVSVATESGAAAAMASTSLMQGQAGQTLRYTGLFTAARGEPVTLRLSASAGATIGFDNVSVRPVSDFTLSTPGEWMRTAWSGPQATSVSCASFGWPADCTMVDTDGRAVALPVSVPAWSAKTLLRADSPWRTR